MRTKNAKLRFFSFLCGEKDKEEDGEFLRRRRGRKKKVKSGDEREQETKASKRQTNKQKNRSPDLSVFSRHQPSFLREKKEKKGMR
tara:strand:+ start:1962 stop:2219 length:258 start_codon:yes stop_codon:yes gene_type:complete